MVGIARGAIAGLIGGFIGAAIWAAIAYAANYEVGFIAWGIGFLVGFCVRLGSGENVEGFMPGVTAAGIALLSIVAGKYAAVHMQASNFASEMTFEVTDEEMIVAGADNIIREREAKGQKVTLPGGKTLDDATSQADYPPAIWNEAEKQWTSLGSDERAQRKAAEAESREAMVAAVTASIRSNAFQDSFSLFDALWFFLAAGTAYKLGHGNMASDD